MTNFDAGSVKVADIEEGQNQGRLQDMTGSYQELLLATEAPFTLANSIQEYTLSTDIR